MRVTSNLSPLHNYIDTHEVSQTTKNANKTYVYYHTQFKNIFCWTKRFNT